MLGHSNASLGLVGHRVAQVMPNAMSVGATHVLVWISSGVGGRCEGGKVRGGGRGDTETSQNCGMEAFLPINATPLALYSVNCQKVGTGGGGGFREGKISPLRKVAKFSPGEIFAACGLRAQSSLVYDNKPQDSWRWRKFPPVEILPWQTPPAPCTRPCATTPPPPVFGCLGYKQSDCSGPPLRISRSCLR